MYERSDNNAESQEHYLLEVQNLLIEKYCLSRKVAIESIEKLKNKINEDPVFIFHYNSAYWAKFFWEDIKLSKTEQSATL